MDALSLLAQDEDEDFQQQPILVEEKKARERSPVRFKYPSDLTLWHRVNEAFKQHEYFYGKSFEREKRIFIFNMEVDYWKKTGRISDEEIENEQLPEDFPPNPDPYPSDKYIFVPKDREKFLAYFAEEERILPAFRYETWEERFPPPPPREPPVVEEVPEVEEMEAEQKAEESQVSEEKKAELDEKHDEPQEEFPPTPPTPTRIPEEPELSNPTTEEIQKRKLREKANEMAAVWREWEKKLNAWLPPEKSGITVAKMARISMEYVILAVMKYIREGGDPENWVNKLDGEMREIYPEPPVQLIAREINSLLKKIGDADDKRQQKKVDIERQMCHEKIQSLNEQKEASEKNAADLLTRLTECERTKEEAIENMIKCVESNERLKEKLKQPRKLPAELKIQEKPAPIEMKESAPKEKRTNFRLNLSLKKGEWADIARDRAAHFNRIFHETPPKGFDGREITPQEWNAGGYSEEVRKTMAKDRSSQYIYFQKRSRAKRLGEVYKEYEPTEAADDDDAPLVPKRKKQKKAQESDEKHTEAKKEPPAPPPAPKSASENSLVRATPATHNEWGRSLLKKITTRNREVTLVPSYLTRWIAGREYQAEEENSKEARGILTLMFRAVVITCAIIMEKGGENSNWMDDVLPGTFVWAWYHMRRHGKESTVKKMRTFNVPKELEKRIKDEFEDMGGPDFLHNVHEDDKMMTSDVRTYLLFVYNLYLNFAMACEVASRNKDVTAIVASKKLLDLALMFRDAAAKIDSEHLGGLAPYKLVVEKSFADTLKKALQFVIDKNE